MGSVYLVGSKELGWYKIGYSVKDDPKDRVKTVSKGVPFSLELICFWTTPFHPEKLEAFLHQNLKDKQLKGEWFKLENSDIASCRERATRFLDDPSTWGPTKRLMRRTTNGRHWKWSEEDRKRRSESMKGKKPVSGLTMKGKTHSEATKDRMSESHKEFYASNPDGVTALDAVRPRGENHVWFGKERDTETRASISKSLEGKTQSETTRNKRSKSLKVFYAAKNGQSEY